ncbi:MAG: hypothetical protein AB2392_20165 [Neobacillus sp.]
MTSQLKNKWILRSIGWAFIIFLTVVKYNFSSQFSFMTTGLGGLICMAIGLFLITYKIGSKK